MLVIRYLNFYIQKKVTKLLHGITSIRIEIDQAGTFIYRLLPEINFTYD